MTLQENIAELDGHCQFELAIKMIEIGLPLWTNYAQGNKLEYTEHVIGTHQTIEVDILSRALEVAKKEIGNKSLIDNFIKNKSLRKILDEFLEPKTAIHDDDFILPKEVELIFHSTYNLLEAINGAKPNCEGETIVYVSTNQSIDAIESAKLLSISEIKDVLRKFYISKGTIKN